MEKKKNTPKLRFPEFTGEWEEKKLGEITNWASGGTPSKENLNYWNGDIPWITASSMRGIEYSTSEVKITEEGLKNGSKLAPKNSLLILVRGSMLFKTIPIGIAVNDVAFNQDVKSIDVFKDNKRFILYWFLASENLILNQVTGTGIGAGKLDLDDLKNMSLSLPVIPEQTKIATFLTAVDEKLTQLKKKKTLLEQYKKGVMQKLFSQELRFKDDNNQDFPDWQEKTLGEISKITNGNGDVQDASLEAKDGWYPFYDRSEIVKYLDRYTFDGEAIIYPGEGQSFFPRYFNGKYGLHQRCYTIKDYCANIHGKYLYYYLSTQNNYFIAFAVGSTVPSLRLDTFQQAKVLLPSLVEQQKIATFLSAIDEKISHSSAQIEKMEAWKKGLLQQMFC